MHDREYNIVVLGAGMSDSSRMFGKSANWKMKTDKTSFDKQAGWVKVA
jgi:hypothetical protein